MATTPLIVGGQLTVATVDFSDAITSASLAVDADEVEIPATLAGPKSARKGGNVYTLTINYLANDTHLTNELFSILWTAVTTGTGQLAFALRLRDGAISATNPEWQGTFVATHASIGGEAEGLSTDSSTFKLTGAPTRAVA